MTIWRDQWGVLLHIVDGCGRELPRGQPFKWARAERRVCTCRPHPQLPEAAA